MTLSDHQAAFALDLARLLLYADSKGIKVTLGEVERTIEQQEIYFRAGKTRTRDSWHMRKLAADLNMFIGGDVTWKYADYKELGQVWEQLSPFNRWGGNFKGFVDSRHFERRTQKRRE